jgi:hypothetical protein
MKPPWQRRVAVQASGVPGRLRTWFRSRFALDLRSLAAFRIAVGTILVVDALLRTRDFGLMFAPDGFFPPATLRQTWNSAPSIWSAAFLVDAAWWGGLVLAVQGLAGGCLACGWKTRAATIAAWAAQLSVVRRTLPATNAGDAWLGALLFWSMFLPLGAAWSADRWKRRAGSTAAGGPAAVEERSISSVASAALMLQVLVVYLTAGLAKWNDSWLSGEAVRRALSVHDHGTAFGMWIAGTAWLARPLTWSVLGMEIVLPLLYLLVPRPRIRLAIAGVFVLFHLAIQVTMSVGLFAAIGIAAWLALIPGAAWQSLVRIADRPASTGAAGGGFDPGTRPTPGRLAWPASAACAFLFALASVAVVHGLAPARWGRLPQAIAAPLNLCGLTQEWGMFGVVYPTEQWVYGPALLADGRRVDLLRHGAVLDADEPRGGCGSLPHHRWHKLVWMLPAARYRPLAGHVAAALVRDWNSRHGPDARVVEIEIRFVIRDAAPAAASRFEQLLASWPERGPDGAGNLGRFLDDSVAEEPPPGPRSRATDASGEAGARFDGTTRHDP